MPVGTDGPTGMKRSPLARAMLRWSAAILGLLLAALVLLEFAQVILRYAFGSGVVWGNDVTVLLLLSLGWLGAAHLWVSRAHLSIELFDKVLSRRLWLINGIADVLVLVGAVWLMPRVFETLVAFQGMQLAALNVTAAVKYLPMALGIALLACAAAANLLVPLLERRARAVDGSTG